MKGFMLIIPADTTEPTCRVNFEGRVPSLRELQAAVGGNLEAVPHFDTLKRMKDTVPCVAFCNEEGKLHGLPMNFVANFFWMLHLKSIDLPPFDTLCGDVAILSGDEEFLAAL